MCGRFALTSQPGSVRARFGYVDRPAFPPRYNISPTQPIATVRLVNGVRRFVLVRWGLVPHWVKDPASFTLLINARAETAAEKPSFRTAMRHRRCLMPASGYYEWRRDGATKQPYWIRPRDGGLIAFAGRWEEWCDPDGGEIETGARLAVPANAGVGWVADGMAAVLAPEDFDAWLDSMSCPVSEALALLKPAPDDLFEAIPVASRVNSGRLDDPGLQEPVADAVAAGPSADRTSSKSSSPANGNPVAAASQQLDLF